MLWRERLFCVDVSGSLHIRIFLPDYRQMTTPRSWNSLAWIRHLRCLQSQKSNRSKRELKSIFLGFQSGQRACNTNCLTKSSLLLLDALYVLYNKLLGREQWSVQTWELVLGSNAPILPCYIRVRLDRVFFFWQLPLSVRLVAPINEKEHPTGSWSISERFIYSFCHQLCRAYKWILYRLFLVG